MIACLLRNILFEKLEIIYPFTHFMLTCYFLIICFLKKSPFEEWEKKKSILSNKPLFPKKQIPLTRKKLQTTSTTSPPLPSLLNAKKTPLIRKENKKIHSPFSLKCPLFSKATMFYPISFAQCKILINYKLENVNF